MFFAVGSHAQITITTPYPAAAQSLTRGLDTSLLTVEVNFLGACSNNIATITLASGVSYVPGSVARTGGTAGITIADLGGTANVPTFSISGVTGAGSIRFTIKRIAGCGSAASGKDAVSVTGSCGSVTENDVNINAYNLFSPALAIVVPPAMNNTVLGATASRNITVTNGGNGCLDTLRYYVVYPSGGIVNTSAGNAITANGVSFTPSSVSGDTLFYKIYGTTLFGGNNLLCNGETVTITENIKVVKCNTNTSYGAAWGRSQAARCQIATGTSAMNMATGVAVPAASVASGSTYASPCVAGNKTWTIRNNGSGGNAGAMYNVVLTFNNLGTKVSLSSGMVGTVPVAFTSNTVVNMAQITSDPDGPGGLQDLDGDGQYDDLAPNDSFNVSFNEAWNCTSACPGNYSVYFQVVVGYTSMCGTTYTPIPINPASNFLNILSSNAFTPSYVNSGEAFPVRICMTTYTITPPGANYNTDSLYVKLTLPAGLSYVPGTATYSDLAVASGDVFMVGNDLYIRKQAGIPKNNSNYNFCIGMNLVYTCQGGSTALSIPFQVYNVRDNSCSCNENLYCGSLTTTANCPSGPCPDGTANNTAQVTRKTLGWTNGTLSTKVNAGSLSSLSKTTLLPYDTFELKQSAAGGAITYANLHYDFELSKAGGQSTVIPLSGTVYLKRGATVFSCALPAVDSSASTATLSKYNWDLTPLFGACFSGIADIQAGDSLAVIMKCVVTNANNGLLYGSTLTQAPALNAYFYQLNGSSQSVACGGGPFAMYLVGLNSTTTVVQNANSSACNPSTAITFQTKLTYGESLNIFPGEFRPQLAVDSFVITWNPAHYTYTASNPALLGGGAYWFNNYTISQSANTNITPTVNIPGKLVFANTGSWPVSELVRSTFINAYSGVVTSGWMPACATPVSSTVNFTAYYRGNYYTYPATLPQTVSAVSNVKGYSNASRPALTAQNNTGVVSGILPQHYWDVQISNASASTAPYVWMAFAKLTGSGIAIDSVVLQPSGQALTAIPYGSGSSWYQVSAAGIPSSGSQQARVYFKYTNCQPDSVLFSAGWNCAAYPADPTAAQCGAASSQYLKVIPQSSQVQIAMDHQPGNGGTISMCSQDSVSVIVNSAQAANLINPNVVIYPPTGLGMTGAVSIEYPLGSGLWQNVTPVPLGGGGYQINLSDHTGIGANGLPGTVLNPAAAGRQARINIPFITGCSFSSGSQLDFFVHGNKPCAAVADGDGLDVKSNPVNIAGASTTGSAAISISMPGGTTLSCGDTRTLNLSVTELSTTTQAGDSVIYTLPAGLSYTGNFTGCASCSLNTQAGSGGTTLVKVSLPAGVPSGTATNYSFDVAATGRGGCTASQINAQAERSIGGLSCGLTSCSTSRVVMGTAPPMPVTINKPTIAISSLSLVSGSWMPGTPTVAVTYQNTGAAAAPANTYISEYFCGSSATPFATHTFTKPLAVNASATDTFVLTIPSAPDCNNGDMITAKVQALTASNVSQCICAPSSYTLGTPLPVRFSELTAKAEGCNVQLYWAYEAINTQVAFFEVQRSEDGRNFTTLSRLDALAHSYNDYTGKKGSWWYRIAVSSTDGIRQYSDVLQAATRCADAADKLVLYPNPLAKGREVTLDFTTERAYGQVTIRCADMTGRIVMEQQATIVGGSNSLHITTAGLAPGTYQVSLYDQQSRIAAPVKMVVLSK